ncbi:MAG: glucokinase [Bacteroidetes bacterium]|nr:MAG: glucokinase [Bacteroidota bacterium]
MDQITVPVGLPRHAALEQGATILAADVGGTKCDLALFKRDKGVLRIQREKLYASQKYSSLEAILRDFIGDDPVPARLSIAFAGPVQQGKAYATNLGWSLDVERLHRDLHIPDVFLINDLEGAAFGLGALPPGDLRKVYPGRPPFTGNAGIVAPGTGLGEAGLFWDGRALYPFATEGGHTDFAPRTPLDWELLQYLQQQFGHVSWERVLSGPGIVHIFNFLWEIEQRDVPVSLLEDLKAGDPAAAISKAAKSGVPVCVETLNLFMRYLAVESSNLALTFNATGGIYLCGGILPKIWDTDLQEVFVEHFIQVGRLRPLIESVPVYLVLNSRAVLLGAAHYGFGA